MVGARKKGAVLSYVLMFAEILSSLFFTPFLIRSFGQSEYGVYSLVSSITSYLYLFDLGGGNAVIRYMAKYRVLDDKKKQSDFLSVILVFYAVIGIVIVIFGFILQHNFSAVFGIGLSGEEIQRAKIMFTITMINAAVTLCFTPFQKTIFAFERYVFSKTTDIIRIVLRVAISFLVLHLGGKGISIVTVNLVLTLLFSLMMVLYHFAVIKIKPSVGKIDIHFVKEIASYSGIVFIQMIATQLNKMADQVIIGMLVASSSAIIGVYAIGAQLANYFESMASSVNGILMPGVVRLVEAQPKPKEFENEMIRIGRMIFMLLSVIYLIFLFFGHDFISLWAGDKNEQAYYVGAIVMFPMMFHLSQSIGAQMLWAMNRHKGQAILQIIVAVLNIFLTIIMIRWNPLFGATIATGITYFIGNVVIQNIVFTKEIGISMLAYYKGLFKGIWLCLLLSALSGFVMHLFALQGWLGLVINCSVMLTMYVAGMCMIGMNQQERELLFSVIKKVCVFICRKARE